MVGVVLTSTFAAFGEQVNCNVSARSCVVSREGATATVASAALGGGTP
jgi:hypothetical protein